jgi:FAD/FMN-containing dehydrogenase
MRLDPDWDALRRVVTGDVVLPSSPDYESVRKPSFARFHDVNPQAVVLCKSASDVAETVALAVRSGLPTATRSGGHCFAGWSSSTGIVMDVTPMRSVTVSGEVATIGAGARLGDVYDSLNEHDRTIPAGSCPSVGIAGLTLGGGLGILGRKYGLTSDHLLAAQIVLADGCIVDCDKDHDQELFWALRGAGSGNFGVVTSLTFRTHRALSATNFHLTWSHTRAAGAIAAWQAWAPAAPDELYASLLLSAGGDPKQPPMVDLFGSMLGGEHDTAQLLDEYVARVGGDPTSEFLRQMSFRETTRYWAGLGNTDCAGQDEHPERLQVAAVKSEFFRQPLPTEAVSALLANLTDGRLPRQHRELDFTPWGGAYNRVRDDATAFVHRGELFSLKHTVTIEAGSPQSARDAAERWLRQSWSSVRPWGTGRVYPNFPDADLENWGDAYYGTNYRRLLRVKATYDPRNIFRFDQSLPRRTDQRVRGHKQKWGDES